MVDNPPFSILSKIVKFYKEKKIKFFLFAPTNTLFGLMRSGDFAFTITPNTITYENGARVSTSFVSNLEQGCICSDASLSNAIKKANVPESHSKELETYFYDKHCVNAARLRAAAKRTDFYIPSSDYIFTSRLDSQKELKRGIFGGGVLLSDKYADIIEPFMAKKDMNFATIWELSERENRIVKEMNKDSEKK